MSGPVRGLLDDLAVGVRLVARLPRYLRDPVTLDEARDVLAARRASREAGFLAFVRDAVYMRPASPYRRLLGLAGCEPGDLERLVRADGVEGALRALYRQGVYLTVDEFKGRRPVVRGSATLAADPGRLRNPLAVPHTWGTTGGSRGASTQVPMSLALTRDRAVNTVLVLDARGGRDWVKAVWGAPGIGPFLRHSGFGRPAARWFSQLDPAAPGLSPRYRWSARVLRGASLLAGVPLPALQPVPVDAPLPIARWMAEVRRAGRVPHLWAFPSSAVRLCEAAGAAGLDLRGAQLTVTGEPVTAARLAAIRRAGADAVPDYGSADSGGFIAYGCLAPAAPDDVHLFDDLNALIQAEAPEPGGRPAPLPPGALLVTALRPTAPFVLLNVSLGDRAALGPRACGCPLAALGWATHLHTIRSYEKLTAGGMTFLDTDVVRTLEEALPARFGGGPTDYQLVEEADAGRPRLRLLVRPSVGPLDPRAVADAFLEAIGAASPTARVMALQWRQAGLVEVERRAPVTTRAGKILHLHAAGPSSAPAGEASQ